MYMYTYRYRTIKSLSQIFPHVYKFIVFYKGCPIHAIYTCILYMDYS